MSKTKGNVINPIDIIERFGTDAVRFTLASMASPGTDIAFSEARTEGYRAFANKIWNAARFLFMNIDRAKEAGISIDLTALNHTTEPGGPSFAQFAKGGLSSEARPSSPPDPQTTLETLWILTRLSKTSASVNESLANYRFDEAANVIYQFFWGDLCDWYLEIVKLRLNFDENHDKQATTKALTTLVAVFEASLRLLSPFMPFITEEIWHALYNQDIPAKSIALTRFPQPSDFPADPIISATGESVAELHMNQIKEIITVIRSLRKDLSMPEKEFVKVDIRSGQHHEVLINENATVIKRLAKVSEFTFDRAALKDNERLPNTRSFSGGDIILCYERQIDVAAERERLTKELARLAKILASTESRLNDPAFIAKAPAHIVDGLRKQHAETKMLYDKTKAALDALN